MDLEQLKTVWQERRVEAPRFDQGGTHVERHATA